MRFVNKKDKKLNWYISNWDERKKIIKFDYHLFFEFGTIIIDRRRMKDGREDRNHDVGDVKKTNCSI